VRGTTTTPTDFGVNTTLYPAPPVPGPEKAVKDLIDADNPALIITAGDNDYVGNYLKSVQDPYGEWVDRQRFWPVPGNHDWDYADLVPYQAYFSYLPGNKRYYEKRFGPAHFFFIDSGYNTAEVDKEPDGNTPGTLDSNLDPVGGSVQWNWFVERVKASTAPWKIALAHHPDLTSGSAHPQYPALAWLWEKLGIDIRMAGHAHSYERLQKGVTTHIVNGLGGNTITGFNATLSPYSIARYNALNGALRLEISAEKVSGRFVDTNGVTQDTFTLTK
jgi:hypothetical protein